MSKLTTILAGLLIVISSAAFATGTGESAEAESKLKVVPAETTNTYKVIYKSLEQGMVYVNFYNEAGEKIFTDKIKNVKGFVRPYNFVAQPKGSYTIEVVDNKGSLVREIKYGKPLADLDVNLLQAEGDKRFKLVVKGEMTDPVYVKIYDSKSLLITEDYIDIKQSFSKIYDLNRIIEANFTFEVISGDTLIKKEIL